MAGGRNGSGGFTYTSAPFVQRTTISSDAVNSNFNEIQGAIINSVAADGQTPNIGPLKGLAGSPGLPTYSFQADTQSGFYLAAPGQVGLALGGVNVATFGPTSMTYAGAVLGGVPTASITAFAGAAAPAGWLLCFGQAVVRTGPNAALFAAIGTTYGIGDGTTTFNVPDLRGRVIAGLNNMGGTATFNLTALTITGGAGTPGNTGGEQQHTLVTAEMPAHTHTEVAPGHTHAVNVHTTANVTAGFANSTQPGASTISDPATVVLNNTGGDGAHNNVQPTMVLNYIIKL